MLVETVSRALAELGVRDCGVLVAVSGGIDSVALLEALAELAPGTGLALAVGHVHHGLRGADADADAECAAMHAARLGLPLRLERVDPRALREGCSKRERPTIQEAARAVRYQALHRQAASCGAAHVATAHTLDDQAETVLLRLLRGAGPDGLGGIPEKGADGVVIRPLLGVPRVEIERFARARALVHREDASNQCDDYARNRLRRHWLPGLTDDFNPRLLRAIGRLAETQRRDAEWIGEIVERALDERATRADDGTWTLAAAGWHELPEALARRVVARLLVRAGAARDLSHAHVLRTLGFLRDCGDRASRPRTLELPGGLRLAATRGGFTLARLDVRADEP